MRKYRITYRNSLAMFGNNIFTITLEGKSAQDALITYALSRNMAGMLHIISAEEA